MNDEIWDLAIHIERMVVSIQDCLATITKQVELLKDESEKERAPKLCLQYEKGGKS